jgi:transposase
MGWSCTGRRRGATVVGTAGDLGIMGTTLSACLKSAGVPVRSRHPRPDDRAPVAGWDT